VINIKFWSQKDEIIIKIAVDVINHWEWQISRTARHIPRYKSTQHVLGTERFHQFTPAR